MARLGCLCGKGMSNSNCPSEDILHVYSKDEIESALQEDPAITLLDFYAIRRPYEFWYCHGCGRVHQVNLERLRVWHTFERLSISEYTASEIDSAWEEIYVFTDTEIDDITEKDFSITLSKFMQMRRTFEYWYQPERNIVQAYSSSDHLLVFAYKLEVEYE